MAPFTVWGKREERYLTVYDVTYDATGYPQFLIYDDGQWLRVSAKHYQLRSDKDEDTLNKCPEFIKEATKEYEADIFKENWEDV